MGHSDCWRLFQKSNIDKDVGELDKHEEPEVSEPNPGPLDPDREEEGGECDDVHDGGDGEEEGDEGLGRHQPQWGVQQENYPEGEVNLDCQPLVPGHAFLHQAWSHGILNVCQDLSW